MSSATVSMERLFDGPGGVNTGGGITRVWENGDLLEKAGVNFSSIVGDNLPSFAAEKFKIPPGTSFHACGVRYKKILLSVSLSLSPLFFLFFPPVLRSPFSTPLSIPQFIACWLCLFESFESPLLSRSVRVCCRLLTPLWCWS